MKKSILGLAAAVAIAGLALAGCSDPGTGGSTGNVVFRLRYDGVYKPTYTAAPLVNGTATHGEGVGYEYRRRGYSLIANLTAYERSTWQPWGFAGLDWGDRAYSKYDLGFSTIVLGAAILPEYGTFSKE